MEVSIYFSFLEFSRSAEIGTISSTDRHCLLFERALHNFFYLQSKFQALFPISIRGLYLAIGKKPSKSIEIKMRMHAVISLSPFLGTALIRKFRGPTGGRHRRGFAVWRYGPAAITGRSGRSPLFPPFLF